MKKKLCVFLVLFAMVMSLFAPAMFAEEDGTTETVGAAAPADFVEGPGGLDFYSVTIHYDKPILVDYVYDKKAKAYLFTDEEGNSAVSDEYIWRAGTTKTNGYYANKTAKSADTNFYQLQSVDLGIPALAHYSKVPYNYAYITHIQDGTVIKTRESVNFYGIVDPYDDGEPYVNKNPNLKYDSDGYALDKNQNEDGSYDRIDINNYRINKDYIWLDGEGQRIELFYQKCEYICTGKNEKGVVKYDQNNIKFVDEYVMIPYEMRFDENGKIRNVSDIKVLQYVTSEEMDSFIEEVKAALEADPESVTPQKPKILEFHVELDDAKMEEMTSSANKKNYKFPKNNYTGNVKYKISKEVPESQREPLAADATAAEGEAAIPMIEDSVYFDKSTTFTMENIVRNNGFLAYGTPVQGEPQLDVKIKDISIEIDAVGSQLYSNAADDPQNKNTIVISLNDFEANCILKKEALDGEYISQEKYDSFSSMILGTINSKTTSTAPNFDKNNLKTDASGNAIEDTNWKSTVESIYLNLDEETLAKIPMSASIFLNFHIQTQQPEEAFDLNQCKLTSKKTSLVAMNAIKYERPAEKLATPKPIITVIDTTPWGLIIGLAIGGVVLVAAIIIAVVLSKKKKAKAQNQ
ncbi:MAG: hypothetical protein J5950_10245 [Clostridia bacterium]|nr:hypothetical protein [Clostridia bacterium]